MFLRFSYEFWNALVNTNISVFGGQRGVVDILLIFTKQSRDNHETEAW